MAESTKRLDFILGPTGVGKNRLAIQVAPKLNAAIVNIDSVQSYAGVAIGANKPSETELAVCPHLLFSHVPIGERATAADYVRSAQPILSKPPRAHLLFVGGSGFYVQALEKGMYPVEKVSLETKGVIQDWQKQGGWAFLHQKLQILDPQTAKRIHPNDHYRIERSLEIVLTLGQSISSAVKENAPKFDNPLDGFQVRKVGLWLEKPLLAEKIRNRAESMIGAGLVEETEKLIKLAPTDWPPLASIGYFETRMFLNGEITKADLPDQITANTMKLIKKQMTWFKRDKAIQWFNCDTEFSKAQDYLYKDGTPF